VFIIDRFEGEWAVIEWDAKVFNLPRSLLPGGAKEGDVLRLSVEVDPRTTSDRRKRIRELGDKLFKR
jgi:hypothetical protein